MHNYTVTKLMKHNESKFDLQPHTHTHTQTDNYMKLVSGKKIVGHSKLKLLTFFWCRGEYEWPLVCIVMVKSNAPGSMLQYETLN